MTRGVPDKIRILFLGEMISSHAQSWMGLLDYASEKFNILGFGVPGSPYPQNSRFKMFLGNEKIVTNTRVGNFWQQLLLKYVLSTYKPHIVHTFGAFPTAALYGPTLRKFKSKTKWVLQVRGGPDVYINSQAPKKRSILESIFKSCDVLIADNETNYRIATELGIDPAKCWSHGIAPGTGGVDLDEFSDAKLPSQSERRVIWPKAYEGYESKGFPVLEAIKLAWPQIKGTKFTFLAGNAELNNRLQHMPAEIMEHICVRTRIPRADALALMKNSRVVMAPSLLEGIPNALYESMAAKCVPLFSPLETYVHKFKDGENIIYARNMHPHEIADALVKALKDDENADRIATNNIQLVAKIANRKKIAENVINLYESLSQTRK